MSKAPARNSSKRNKVRIIGGAWRGRTLDFVDAEGLRPSPDRLRETLFNWLQQDIVGARCLDLFAGSGVLGLEALSRGATAVTALELAAPVCDTIRANRERLGATELTLLQADALTWLGARGGQQTFDLVFLDPPFASELLEPACRLLEEQPWLAPGACIYLESGFALEALSLPANWELAKSKQAGRVFYGLCRRKTLPKD